MGGADDATGIDSTSSGVVDRVEDKGLVPKPGLYWEESLKAMIGAAIPPLSAPDRATRVCSSLLLYVAPFLVLSSQLTP